MRSRKKRSDYSRVDEALSRISEDIEFEMEGKTYGELDEADQRSVLLDHFFNGNPQYTSSAEDMRIGLEAYQSGSPSEISVDQITRRGINFRVIRDAKTGRIRHWVK